MPRRVFYSFHHQLDSWRTSQIRKIGTVDGNIPAADNKWEEVKRGGDAAIRSWIDDQLKGRSCTIVLVGAETANRRFVKYEIERSWNDADKGVFGIRIHRLLDQEQRASIAGPNPFAEFALKDGTSLASRVVLHDPPGWTSKDVYGHISENLAQWIEAAIGSR